MDERHDILPFPEDLSAISEVHPKDFIPLRLHLQGTENSVELLNHDVVLGRHSEADVRIPLPDVSRRHCRLVFTRARWFVQDLQSLNGTFVNGVLVEGWKQLQQGDLLSLGGFTFHLEIRNKQARPSSNSVLSSIVRALPAPKEDGTDGPQRRAS